MDKPGHMAADIPTEVRAAFERIDTDCSGSIDRNELLALLRALQPKRYFGEAAVDESLREMGADADGQVSLPAFHEWWEAGGKLTPGEKFDKQWQDMQARFDSVMSGFANKFAASLGVVQRPTPRHNRCSERRLASADLKGVAEYILSGRCRSVSLLTGAGVSVGAGIPDFRSPGGMYDTLRPDLLTATPDQRKKMALNPTHVVSWQLFQENPLPYFELRRPFILGLAEGQWKPTAAHFFMRVLHDKGLLSTVFTQNIDGLDAATGIPSEKLLHCHGTMGCARCEFCDAECPLDELRAAVRTQIKDIYGVDPSAPAESTPILCKACGRPGVKSATVLYGSSLPQSFADGLDATWPEGEETEREGGTSDLLIISGTSLTVSPANSVLPRSGPQTPKVLINRELVGEDMGLDLETEPEPSSASSGDWLNQQQGEKDGEHGTSKDVFFKGDADDGFIALAAELGWLQELSAYLDRMADDSAIKLRAAIGRVG